MIIVNQVRCLLCGDDPQSVHVHDFKYCKCNNVAVDGGTHYLKRSYVTTQYEEISIEVDTQLVKKVAENFAGICGSPKVFAQSILGNLQLNGVVERPMRVTDEMIDAVDTAVKTGATNIDIVCAVLLAIRDSGYVIMKSGGDK